MNRKIVVLALLALLAAAAAGSAVAQAGQDSDPFVIRAKAAISAQMKDPESAQFRDVAHYKSGTIDVLCGSINAKNSFGGYVGFTPFLVMGNAAVLRENYNADVFDRLSLSMCQSSPAQAAPASAAPSAPTGGAGAARQYRCTDEKGQPYITVTADPPSGCVVQ